MSSVNYGVFSLKCPALSSVKDIEKQIPFRFSERISANNIAIYEGGFWYVKDTSAKAMCDAIQNNIVLPDPLKSYLVNLDTQEVLYNYTDKQHNFRTTYRISAKSKEEDKALGYVLALNKDMQPVCVSCYAGIQYMSEFLFLSTYMLGEHVENCGNSLAIELFCSKGSKWAESYIKKDIKAMPYQIPPKKLNTEIIDRFAKVTVVAPEDDKFYLSEILNYQKITCDPEEEVFDDLKALPANTRLFIGKEGIRVETNNFLATKAYIAEILGFWDFLYVYIGR